MPRGTTFPKELRERAVRMVAEIGEPGVVRRVAEKHPRRRHAACPSGNDATGERTRSGCSIEEVAK